MRLLLLLLLFLLLLALRGEAKPPKNLNRMRGKMSSGGGQSMKVGAGEGQMITVFEETDRDEEPVETDEDDEEPPATQTSHTTADELRELLDEVATGLPDPTTTRSPDAETISDTDIISELLNNGYDWRVRPPGVDLNNSSPSHGPVKVSVNMLIRSISKIDDVNMEYSVQLTFRERWIDGRLAYGLPGDNKPPFVILTTGQEIWKPDSFFQNEKQAQKHMIDKPNVLIRVHSDGKILYSVRISLVLSCPMHLQYYPMDVQTCLIDLASYAYTTNDIEYEWDKEGQPIQLKDGLSSSLPSFHLSNYSTTYCTSTTNTGSYSCLRTVLELKRQFSYYLLQVYAPTSMLVIVSWVSFWLDRTAVPARVTLGVTTLLTMTTQASGINAKLPPVSYTKAIDVWIGACLTFVFCALLEFAWVTYVSSRTFYKGNKEPKMSSLLVAAPQQVIIPNTNADFRISQLGSQGGGLVGASTEGGDVWVKQRPAVAGLPRPPPGASTALLPEASEVVLLSNGEGNGRVASLAIRGRRRGGIFARAISRCCCIRWMKSKLDVADPAKKADLVSRFLFPLCFICFNLAYWFNYSRYPTKQ